MKEQGRKRPYRWRASPDGAGSTHHLFFIRSPWPWKLVQLPRGGRGPPRLGTRKAEAGHTSNECSEDTAVISEAQWMARHVSGGVQEGRELDPRWL